MGAAESTNNGDFAASQVKRHSPAYFFHLSGEAFFEDRRASEAWQTRGFRQTQVLDGLMKFIATSKILSKKFQVTIFGSP